MDNIDEHNNSMVFTSKELKNKEGNSLFKLFLSTFLDHKAAVFGALVILMFLLIAIGADAIAFLTGIDPDYVDILNRYQPPSSEHILGTDEAGRDVFIRLVYGARVSIGVAVITAISSAVIGISMGAISGYFGGWIDSVIMRIVDSLLALPIIPILIIVSAIDLGKVPLLNSLNLENSSVLKMVVVLVAFSWMVQARLIRGTILTIKNQEYILAARSFGMSSIAIIFKEILPNVLSPLIVSITLTVGSTILYEAALSFLGLGISPPTPSWGNMLNNAQEIIHEAPHLAIIPGLLILLVVVSFNFLGDGLQDALDPKALKK